MIFRAKVRLNGQQNAQELLRAFFKEFNQKSSIEIEGGQAEVKIIFDKPPMEIIEAVGKYEVIEFSYGQNTSNQEESKTAETKHGKAQEVTLEKDEPVELEKANHENTELIEAEEVFPEQPDLAEAEVATPEQSEVAEKQGFTEEHAKSKAPVRARKVSKEEEIPKLAEIAKKSSSYEQFVTSVIAWIGFEFIKWEEFFGKVIEAASQTEKITWESIKETLESKGIAVNEYVKIQISKHITEKFENDVKMMKLIRAIVTYKSFDFQGTSAQEETEKVEAIQTEIPMEPEATTSKRVKMKCMPEIPPFEEALGNVDKTQPIEERVRFVLTEMGLEKLDPSSQQNVFEFAKNAVMTENVEDTIFSHSEDFETIVRLTFSTFLNDFVSQYDSTKNVKVFDFLKELQRIVS